MTMQTVTITKLSKPVRDFLARVRKGNGLLVQDEHGRTTIGVIPYRQASPTVRQKAWKDIEKVQRKVAARMRRDGKTEEELDRILREQG